MKPAPLNLPTIWRGCDWGPVTLKWKDKDGIALDLRPTQQGAWQCRAQSLNIFLGAAITEPLHGVTTLSLGRDETALFKLGVESWDWIWEHVNHQGIVDYRFPPFLAGKVQIKDPTTKAGIDPLIPNLPSDDDPPELVEAPPIFSLPS